MVALLGSFPSASLRDLVLVFLKATLTVFASVVVVFSSSARGGAFGRRRLEESSSIHRDDAFIGYSERSSSKSSSVTTTCVDESLMCPSWAANGACDSTTTRAFMTQICCCGAFFFRTPTPTTRDFTTGTLRDDVLDDVGFRVSDDSSFVFLLFFYSPSFVGLRSIRATQRVARNVHEQQHSRKETTMGRWLGRREKKKRRRLEKI